MTNPNPIPNPLFPMARVTEAYERGVAVPTAPTPPAPPPAPPPSSLPDYDRMSLNRLRELATARGIPNVKIYRKHQLAALLTADDGKRR